MVEAGRGGAAVALLATLLLLEGMRRVPAGAIVLQRFLWSPWRVHTAGERSRLRLLSWWPPLTASVVLAPAAQTNGQWDLARARARLAELRPLSVTLQVLGLAILLTVSLAIPIVTTRFGASGFYLALGATLLLCGATCGVSLVAGRGPLWSLRFLYPFTAPRAAELLLEDFLRGLPPGVAVRLLLRDAAFVDWIRPHVYDHLHGNLATPAPLLEGLTIAELREPMSSVTAADPGAALWCPRCGARFIRGNFCPECVVELVAMRQDP